MTDAIIVALISSSVTLGGTILTIISSMKKSGNDLKLSQAVTDQKIEELTREVRAHNNFAQRMPAVEQKLSDQSDRIARLEKKIDERNGTK